MLKEVTIRTGPYDITFQVLTVRNAQLIHQTTQVFRSHFQSICIKLRADTLFSCQLEDGRVSFVPGYFSTLPELVNSSSGFDFNAAVTHFNAHME